MVEFEPVGALVVTDREGRIVALNQRASKLLRLTVRGIERKPRMFSLFFAGDRAAILDAYRTAGPDHGKPIRADLRPVDRGALEVTLTVREAADGFLEWVVYPQSPGHGRQTDM